MKELKNRIKLPLSLLIIFSLAYCKKEESISSTKDTLYEYNGEEWKSNSYTFFINEINYTATEVPLKYYLLKNETNGNIDSIYEKHKKERILEIEFQHSDKKDLLSSTFTHRDFKKSVEYMAFAIKKDFQIITDSKDTILCSGVLFERNYKVSPFKRLLIYFDDVKPNESIRLLYDDQLFGNGLIKFNFSKRPIEL